jgi:large subunit ribosomal protein L23
MAKPILIKPLITEKAETLSEGLNKYSFVVAKWANKVEIRKAVQDMYGVNVTSVNTAIMPGKAKNRTTKSGVLKGRVAAYKKAVVTLVDGEEIDFFGDI